MIEFAYALSPSDTNPPYVYLPRYLISIFRLDSELFYINLHQIIQEGSKGVEFTSCRHEWNEISIWPHPSSKYVNTLCDEILSKVDFTRFIARKSALGKTQLSDVLITDNLFW